MLEGITLSVDVGIDDGVMAPESGATCDFFDCWWALFANRAAEKQEGG